MARDVQQDQNFLADPKISSDNLSLNPEQTDTAQSPFRSFESVRTLYSNKDLLQWLLPLLTVLLAGVGVWLTSDRQKALKRLGRAFIGAAAGLVLLAVLVGFGLSQVIEAVAREQVSWDVLAPVAQSLLAQMRNIYLVCAVVAAILVITLHFLQRKLAANSGSRKLL